MPNSESDDTTLASLISGAAAAPPADRMEFRDALAAFGLAAIAPMTSLLRDPKLGPLAVRVLTKIAQESGYTKSVLAALRSVVRLTPALQMVSRPIRNARSTKR
jgi:hypothetical protein